MTSDKIAMASCTFPSLKPPITRESMYEANDVDWTQLCDCQKSLRSEIFVATYTTALAILPIIVNNKMRLRPYLSDNAPIWGETMNCSVLTGWT